jgi:hypothetical protein
MRALAGSAGHARRTIAAQRVLLACTTAMLLTVASADAQDRQRGGDRRWQEQQQERQQGRHESRGRGQQRYERREGPAYRYAEPVYAPPPVYYQPQSSPGISLFLPFDLRR